MYGFIEYGKCLLDNKEGHLDNYRIVGLPANIMQMTDIEISTLSKIHYGCFKDSKGQYRLIHQCVPGCDITTGVYAASDCVGNALYRDGTTLHLNYRKTNNYNSWSSAIKSFKYYSSKNSYGLDKDDKTIFCGIYNGIDVYWDLEHKLFLANGKYFRLGNIRPKFPLFDPSELINKGKSFLMVSEDSYLHIYKNGKFRLVKKGKKRNVSW